MKHLVELRILQIRAIVDANVIHADLIWRLGSRQKAEARSGLEEAIDAGVLVLIAPDFLNIEIEKYLPAIARSFSRSVLEARAEWERLRAKLHFYQPSSRVLDAGIGDPKDLPYKQASLELSLPVYTRDMDLRRMGAPGIWVCIDETCRDHARAISVELGVTVGSAFSATIGIEMLRAALCGLKNVMEGFRQLPAWLQLTIICALAGVVLHPRTRTKLLETWNSVVAAGRRVRAPLLEGLVPVAQQIFAAQTDATKTYYRAQAVLPPAKTATALIHARRICVVNRGPIQIHELVDRMRNEGYKSRAKDPEPYLRRVLRKSGQFTELSPGLFQLSAAA